MTTAAPKPERPPKTVKLRLTFECLEHHTVEVEMPRMEFLRIDRDMLEALDERFRDAPMPDADIETLHWELDRWEIIK